MPLGRHSSQLFPAPVQAIAVVAVCWSVARADPAPGFDGRALVVLVALAVGVAAFAGWSFQRDRGRDATTPILMAMAGGVLCWASPNSAGSALAFMACFGVGARLEPSRAVPTAAGGVLAVAVAALAYDGSFAGTAAYGLGFVATMLAGANRRASLLRVEEAELLLVQTQRSHEEQVRAAALTERTRIARDVHDVLAHSLAGLTIQLDAARLLLERSDADGRPLQHVERAHDLAREGLREAREAVGALRGDAVPLSAGLQTLVEDRRRTSAPATLDVEGDVDGLAADTAWAVLRIAREAVTNVQKHAPLHALGIRLAVRGDDVELTVEDHPDGDRPATSPVGSGLAATGGGYGLQGMSERAKAIGGTVEAGPYRHGWRVVARLPVAGAPAGPAAEHRP
ncbi:sensor histidine kinase [Patulibacter sp.]|uniref:sensor histidine kinase n=1 Tax=Patulibacter sp. TaxID=1912859 RepID=UPI00271EEB9F|nr:histidine kinase [Patulibacter sp.]MDO9407178.1 histidine kinase [Patulibacter sp.]